MKNIFTNIVAFEDYLIYESGRIISLKNGGRKELKICKGKQGYCYVNLCEDGKRTFKQVHRLVAQHFIPNPDNLPEVNHLDGDKSNNHKSNLEWCTSKQNKIHGTNLGLYPSGIKHCRSKLTESDVLHIRNLKGIKTQKELSLMFGVSRPHISLVQSGKRFRLQ